MMKYLQKLGKALMLPVAVPICGILMGLGYALVMGVPGAASPTVGFLLVKAGGAIIGRHGVGLADNDGTAGLAGLVSYLMMQPLLSPGVMVRTLEEGTATYIAFPPATWWPLLWVLPATTSSRDDRLTGWHLFLRQALRCDRYRSDLHSGVRCSAVRLARHLRRSGRSGQGHRWHGRTASAGIYAFLNRLLIPTGLHHALNNVFWFDTIGLGDLSHFWAGETSADVDWSLGMYMSGFFPCMMFGIMGAALAMVKTAKNKKAAIGLVLSAAICAFVCGVTEPFEFGFMFLCFPLYVVYSALYGIFTIITYYTGFRAGFCFSAGATDLIFSASLPAAAKTWMIIPLGIAAFLVFYFVFYFAITKFDLKTPAVRMTTRKLRRRSFWLTTTTPKSLLLFWLLSAAKENVKDVGYCATRLRFEVKAAKVDEKAVKRRRCCRCYPSQQERFARSSSAPRCSSCTTS